MVSEHGVTGRAEAFDTKIGFDCSNRSQVGVYGTGESKFAEVVEEVRQFSGHFCLLSEVGSTDLSSEEGRRRAGALGRETLTSGL